MYFFFSSRRRHTRFDCDWSSDVCSSDLFDPTSDAAEQVELPGHLDTGGVTLAIAFPACKPGGLVRTGARVSTFGAGGDRSEERRVGKECRSRGLADL